MQINSNSKHFYVSLRFSCKRSLVADKEFQKSFDDNKYMSEPFLTNAAFDLRLDVSGERRFILGSF